MLKLFLKVIVITLIVHSTAYGQSDIITRLYYDFAGRRPSSNELNAANGQLKAATTSSEKRQAIQSLLEKELFTKDTFERRLRNYFNGIFGVATVHGEVMPGCTGAVNSECVTVDEATDFRDEMAMYISRLISGRDTHQDIRDLLLSERTVITPRMAKKLKDNTALQTSLGLANIDQTRLSELAALAVNLDKAGEWFWIDRDPSDNGLANASTTSKSHREKHSGVLTSPAYLLKGTSHLARANYLHSWFMCDRVSQINEPENQEPKLALRKPCAGCHAVLEPLGSFWVHWRPKIVVGRVSSSQGNVFANWVMDGQMRTETPLNGVLPLDELDNTKPDYTKTIHSRQYVGSYFDHKGTGVRSVAQFAASSGKFATCMAKHAWQFVLGRKMEADEQGWADMLGDKLANEYKWSMREVITDIVMSPSYSGSSLDGK